MKKLILSSVFVISIFCSSNSLLIAQDVDLYLDDLNVYVSDYGRVALYSLPDTIRQVYRTALLVGTGPEAVFDLIYDLDIEEQTTLLSTPSFGDYEIYGSYNNNYSGAPPNVLEKENIYCWQNLNSIIIKYTVINREDNSIDAINGWEFLPRIDNNRSGGDTVIYSSQDDMIVVRNNKAVGFKVLSENLKSLSSFYYYTDYEADTLFWNRLNYSAFDESFITDPNSPTVDAPAIIPALNSKTIASGDSIIIYVALAYGKNESEMLSYMQAAESKYSLITDVEKVESVPIVYMLNQNYPNPFNPNTKISYQIPQNGFVTLKVYNVLGKEVASLVNEVKSSGSYDVDFNASNLTSGVYFYTLTTNNFSQTNKMLLLK